MVSVKLSYDSILGNTYPAFSLCHALNQELLILSKPIRPDWSDTVSDRMIPGGNLKMREDVCLRRYSQMAGKRRGCLSSFPCGRVNHIYLVSLGLFMTKRHYFKLSKYLLGGPRTDSN